MNVARELYRTILGVPDHENADLVLAVKQTQHERSRYDAPHKMRGTPQRPRHARSGVRNRLFKGHRP